MAAKSLERLQTKNRWLDRQCAVQEDNIRAINNARLELERKLRETQDTLQEARAKNTLLNVENATLKTSLKHVEAELVQERRRVAQALDIAEESSHAAGSIGRLTHTVSETVIALNMTIENINKNLVRR